MIICCSPTPSSLNFPSSLCPSLRFGLHRLRQPVPELLGHHHLWVLRFPASSVPVGHGLRLGLAASPHPGLAAALQPAGDAPDALGPGGHHAGQRALLPLLPHAALPPLLPAGPVRRHPGPAPLLHRHDALRMTPPWLLKLRPQTQCNQLVLLVTPHPVCIPPPALCK